MTSPEKLLDEARAAMAAAYAPYSGFKVAAVAVDESDRTFSGVNIENASFGLTLCAERVAISNAISAGAKRIRALAIIAEKQNPCKPCGACLQVMAEFADDAPIYLVGPDGRSLLELSLSALLPQRFDAGKLLRRSACPEG